MTGVTRLTEWYPFETSNGEKFEIRPLTFADIKEIDKQHSDDQLGQREAFIDAGCKDPERAKNLPLYLYAELAEGILELSTLGPKKKAEEARGNSIATENSA